jgi:GTP cyclohydrolase I
MLNTVHIPAFIREETSASTRIRARLRKAGQDFRANDNIAAVIEDGELDELRLEVEDRMQEVLQALVIDTDNDHNTADTSCAARFSATMPYGGSS